MPAAKTRADERAKFVIVNDGCAVSFSVNGSTVAAIDEAFGWLSPERRVMALKRLEATQARLLAAESEAAKTALASDTPP